MSQNLLERKALLEKAGKIVVDKVEEVVNALHGMPKAQTGDEFHTMHSRQLAAETITSELNHLYGQALNIKKEIDKGKKLAKEKLSDAEMEAVQRPTFKPHGQYVTSQEVSAKLRSLTFEEHYELRIWEELSLDIEHLVNTIKIYQKESSDIRWSIELRLKLLSQGF